MNAVTQITKRSLGTKLSKLFVAAPMSGFDSDEEYARHRRITLELIETIKSNGIAKKVYYAGEAISSSTSYSGSNNAFASDVSNLVDSQALIFLYPNKVVSSALVEVGIAIGRCMPILIAVKSKKDLPYMIQDVESYVDGGNIAPPITIIETENPLLEIDRISQFFLETECRC